MRTLTFFFLFLFNKTNLLVFSKPNFLNPAKNKTTKFISLFIILLVMYLFTSSVTSCFAEDNTPANTEDWSYHFQSTAIVQGHGSFTSSYAGKNSLKSDNEVRETFTSTFFLGKRLWANTELYMNPELTQGKGFDDFTGIAGFPNGEATRAGKIGTSLTERNVLWVSLARIFVRHTINLEDKLEPVEPDKNQLVGKQALKRFTITAGKLSATDIFDKNSYANDSRTQFLNCAFVTNGAWDYPADSKGYTVGWALELNQVEWAARAGSFLVPRSANGPDPDLHFWKAFGTATELERRYKILNREGAIRLLGFINRAHMGKYKDAIDSADVDVTESRKYRYKFGSGINLEQALTNDLGAFMRLGWNDGRTETWAFVEIDRTASLGLSLKGSKWHRSNDTVGLAGVINGISKDHRGYLKAGGLGFMLGDGNLNYEGERCFETYYSLNILKGTFLTFDYQLINNPGYNEDRGPVSVFSMRIHFEV